MNQDIFYFLNNLALQNEWLDVLIIFLANWLIWWLVAGVIILFILKKISLRHLFQIFTVAFFAWIISKLIKYSYFSPRPFASLAEVKTLLVHGLNDSLPSGHTTFAFALATALSFYTNHKISILFFVGASLIGLSRVIAGIHWPADILAGVVIGITVTIIFLFNQK